METLLQQLRHALNREHELDRLVDGDRRARLEAQLAALDEREACQAQFQRFLTEAASTAEEIAAQLRAWSTAPIDPASHDVSWSLISGN